ncbi:MAG: vitamin K epoxide reductase family protein [Halobacteriales archaeon]|nr:vitamin K epoxide reductase family protein [Halobacteriales archaeon]
MVDAALVAFAALGALGFLDALYFTLVTYRVMPADARWVPRFCRMDGATCAVVVEAPEARLLRVPNSVLGLGWYAIVLVHAASPLPCLPMLAASAATVMMSAYLAWALLRKLRTPCPLCFLGHAVNGAIFVVLAFACSASSMP